MGDEPEYTPSEFVPKHSAVVNDDDVDDEQSKDFERKAPVMMTSWKEQQNSLRRMHAGDHEPSRIARNPSSNMLTRERLTRNASNLGESQRQLPSRGLSRTASRQLPARGVSRSSSRQVPTRGVSRGVSRSTSRRLPAREISRTSSRLAGGEASEDDGDLETMAMALQQSARFDLAALQESQLQET